MTGGLGLSRRGRAQIIITELGFCFMQLPSIAHWEISEDISMLQLCEAYAGVNRINGESGRELA